MSRVVIFHGHCDDGFGAAWAAWRALGDTDTRYVPAFYGNAPPEVGSEDEVFVLDFSYPRDVLLALRARCASLRVLDHHRSAQEDLAGLEWATFDLDKSGAMLAWEHWHPGVEPPPMIQYIQDRDLWRFRLPLSREVSAWLRSYPMEFRQWIRLADDLKYEFLEAAQSGEAILRFQVAQVEVMCQQAIWLDLSGHRVPVVNATAFFSEVGERLLELHPDATFACYYLDRADGRRQWALRSRPGFDVSAVAKEFGGGGHPQAAGFTKPAPWPVMTREGFQ